MSRLRRSVCVFCGSRPGRDPAHAEMAGALGRMLARERLQLVYGAGDVGLMGEVANAALAEGGEAMGVIPVHLIAREAGRRDLTRFVVTETMHERKKVMFMNADAIVTLPGGPGTLDEFFEVVTWRQLGLHAKPVYLLNAGGYWDPLLALVDHMISGGFAPETFRTYVTPVADVDELAARLRTDLA